MKQTQTVIIWYVVVVLLAWFAANQMVKTLHANYDVEAALMNMELRLIDDLNLKSPSGDMQPEHIVEIWPLIRALFLNQPLALARVLFIVPYFPHDNFGYTERMKNMKREFNAKPRQ